MTANELNTLQKNLRLRILNLYFRANAGHIGCSLSCIDLLIGTLIANKTSEDRFILSKGHAAAALYVCLNYLGEIPEEELESFYREDTHLPAHPAPNTFKSIPFATGSLGHGFPVSAGMAKAKKLKAEDGLVYTIMSDGETNEGTTWEAAHFSVQHKLDNMLIIIDKNGIQGIGHTKDVLGDSSDKNKWLALGFEVYEINGHNLSEIISTTDKCRKNKNGKPKLIIANTVKGKGISFMENKIQWHYLPMDKNLYDKAIKEIHEAEF